MNEEILKQLIAIFAMEDVNEETEVIVDGKLLNIKLKKEGNDISLNLSYKEDEFENYINSLDEDIFIEACERFEDLTGEQLNNNIDHDTFKAVVHTVASERIEDLKKLL